MKPPVRLTNIQMEEMIRQTMSDAFDRHMYRTSKTTKDHEIISEDSSFEEAALWAVNQKKILKM